jgi:hypothetical protein
MTAAASKYQLDHLPVVCGAGSLSLLQDGKTISWPVSRRDLKLWLGETYPVILIVYDGQRNKAYWLSIHPYFAERSASELFTAGETMHVHISVRYRVNQRSIEWMAGHKRDIHKQLQRQELSHD